MYNQDNHWLCNSCGYYWKKRHAGKDLGEIIVLSGMIYKKRRPSKHKQGELITPARCPECKSNQWREKRYLVLELFPALHGFAPPAPAKKEQGL